MDVWKKLFFWLFSRHVPMRTPTHVKCQRRSSETYRSDSSAAADASDNLAEAEAKRSSERSRSSSNNWIRRFKAATSDSACKVRENRSEMEQERETFYNSVHVVNCLLFMRERNELLPNIKSFRDPLRNLHLVECSRDQISIRIFGLHVSRLCIGQSTIVEKMPTNWNTMTMRIQRVLSHVDVCGDRRNYFFAYTTK